MTEREYLNLMLRNADVSIGMAREEIVKSEARIEAVEGYKQAFANRLRELDKSEGK